MKKTLRAFNLTEILVAVAVLGLIMALILPSAYSNYQRNAQKMIWKDTISTMQMLYIHGGKMGYTRADLNTYIMDNMGGVSKMCKNNALAEGCYINNDNGNESSEGGFEMVSGATVNGMIRHNTYTGDHIWLDVNGKQGPNIEGEDRMYLRVCLDYDQCAVTDRGMMAMLGPHSSQPVSAALYESIFHNK